MNFVKIKSAPCYEMNPRTQIRKISTGRLLRNGRMCSYRTSIILSVECKPKVFNVKELLKETFNQ